MEELRVHIEMSQADITKGMEPLISHQSSKTASAQSLAVVLTTIFMAALLFLLGETGFYSKFPPVLLGLSTPWIFIFALVLFLKIITKIKPIEYNDENGSLRRPRDILINAEGLHQTCDKDKTFFKWSAIRSVEEDKHTILLYIDTSAAFLIPKRFFENETAATQFYTQALEYWIAANPLPPWGNTKIAQADTAADTTPQIPFSKWYFHNLLCGLRQAVFVPSQKRVIASSHALVAIIITFFASQGLVELWTHGWGGELTYYWYLYITILSAVTFVMAYIISSHIYKTNRAQDIAVTFLNSFYFLFLPYTIARTVFPDAFYAHDGYNLTKGIFTVWTFMAMLSLCKRLFGIQTLLKPAVAGAAGAILIYAFINTVHFSPIYYVYQPDDAQASILDEMTNEEMFSMQADLREKALQSIKPSKKGATDIYAVALAPYGYQDIFMREAHYVGKRLQEKLGITNVIQMISNEDTVKTTALANTSNLNAYLQKLSADYMQPDEDIALIFMTSHGDPEAGLSVGLGHDFSQLGISPARLKKILDDSGIKNKIIIISACHSGTFIPHLQDDNTMIITAAAKDRTSFGCSDEYNLTYFTESYFKVGLEETTDIEEAFVLAKAEIERREKTQNITPASNPQIFVGAKIKEALRKYKPAKLAAKDKPDK